MGRRARDVGSSARLVDQAGRLGSSGEIGIGWSVLLDSFVIRDRNLYRHKVMSILSN